MNKLRSSVGFVCGLAFILAMAFAIYSWRMREPGYRGKTLDEWLLLYRSDSVNGRIAATNAIRNIANKTVPSLLRTLKSKDPQRRAEAVRGIQALGSAAESAIPTLEETLWDEGRSHNHTVDAAAVLAGIGPAAIPVLTNAVASAKPLGEDCIRIPAIEALGSMGPAAKSASPLLLQIARQPDHPCRDHAISALRKMGEPLQLETEETTKR